MRADSHQPREESLDPEDWSAMRSLGHRMLDDMFDFLQAARERPVWQPMPDEVVARFRSAAPRDPEGIEQPYRDFVDLVLPFGLGSPHPRFWAWVVGTGTPYGMLADMLAAGLNSNCAGHQQAATRVEEQVVRWLAGALGFPPSAGGLLQTGGSMANLVGLAAARTARAGFDVRRHGLRAAPRPLVLYASAEVHNSVQKAVELLGLGSDALRRIAVDAEYRMDVAALEAAIARDRAAGHHPFCIVGGAGTVNTGAFDDLAALADICRREGLWLHVDGAFGALAALAPAHRHLTRGMERADSLAFDLHKWMYVNYDAGCALVRDPEHLRATFAAPASYLARFDRGIPAGSTTYGELGPELSRGFRALKVWMSIKEHGLRKYGRLVAQNIAQARHLADLVRAAPDLELLAPVPLNIVCFRFVRQGLDDERLNALNRELLVRLQERGIAAPSHTTLHGRFAIRASIVNHRSRRDDFDLLVREVRRLGREIAG